MEETRRIIRRTPEASTDSDKIKNVEQPIQDAAKQSYESTNDSEFDSNYKSEISKEMEKASDDLIAFVSEKINNMNNKILFNGNREPEMWEIDSSLMLYEQTLFALIASYESAKVDEDVAKENFNEWYATKYMEIRNKYNTKDVKNASWLSAKEIEQTVYSVYKSDAAKMKADIIVKERERSTIEHLMNSWESYQYILTQLSKNTISEKSASLIGVDLKRGDENE